MKAVWLILCYLVSCFICTFIIVRFMEDRYRKVYQKKWIYGVCYVGISVIVSIINYQNMPLLNYFSWIGVVAVWAGILYYEPNVGSSKRILESEAFFITIAFTETMGVLLVEWFTQNIDIADPMLITFMEVLFSKVVILLFYYLVVRPFISGGTAGRGRKAYMPVLVMMVYSAACVLAIVKGFFQRLDLRIVAINVSCIAFINLYLLSYIRAINEKKQHDEKVKILEQQAKLQYEYYVQQEEKYNETLSILHDVNKHIQMINELAASGNAAETSAYAEQIRDTLKPLIPAKYTGNPILDILLSDKIRQMQQNHITYEINLGGIDFGFMDAIDTTTIFGNLLDNAIEACEAVADQKEKHIFLSAKRQQEMVSVTLQNDSNPVSWKAGMPVSEKGENRGIGLRGVHKSIERYDGCLKLWEENGEFVTEFFVNMRGTARS